MRHPVTNAAVMAAVMISVILFLIELQLPEYSELRRKIELIGDGFIVFFIVELSLRWYAAPSTKRFWREYWLDVLAVIPVFRAIRVLRILRFLRALRLLRIYRLGSLAKSFMGGEGSDYENKIREEVGRYRGKFADQILLAPELFRLLTNLLEDGRVHGEARTKILTALAYFVTPFEVMPRQVYGAEGYLDQIFICLKTVGQLREELPDWLIEEAWEGEGNILDILVEELPMVEEVLEPENIEALKKYLGQ